MLTVAAVYLPMNGGNVTVVIMRVTSTGYTNRLRHRAC